MPCNHVMLDLETLSTRKDAAIIQIAAVKFDPQTGELGDTFNAFVLPATGHIDPGTVAWWMQQAPAARVGAAMNSAADSNRDDSEGCALRSFAHFMTHLTNGGIEALWSHGATFDIVVLENAYARNGAAKPWSYKIERDTRTLYALAVGGMPTVWDVDANRKHDAAYDCEVQVQQVVGALRALRQAREAVAPTERAPEVVIDVECVPGPRVFAAGTAFESAPEWSAAEARCEGEANQSHCGFGPDPYAAD